MSKQSNKTDERQPGTDVAVRPTAALVDPSLLAAMEEDTGLGLEAMKKEDKAIPFIGVIQGLSPQLKKADPKFIAGAEQGDVFNTVSGELFKAEIGVTIVPVHFRKTYIEWVPRDEGGGFVGQFETREETGAVLTETDKGKKWINEAGNHIVDTAEHFVLIQSADGTWNPAVLSMTSTKLKVSRSWNTRMSMVRIPGTQKVAPSFSKAYVLRTALQKNNDGEWYNYVIDEVPGFVPAAVYELAKDFRRMLLSGEAKVDYAKAATDEATGGTPEEEPKF